MTLELAGAILFFILTVFAFLFSLTKSSQIDKENFPNRGRFFLGLVVWILAAILAIFISFPGYVDWFVPIVYPILKSTFLIFFLVGFFVLVTTLLAFPQHMNYYRREIDGRSDRIALLENIRQIVSQPFPITELFTLVLKEIGSFLVVQKGAVFLINPSRRELFLAAHIGLEKDELSRLERFSLGQDIISRAASEQSSYISGDLAVSDSASRKLLLAGRDLTLSAAALPLSSRDRSLGALLILSDQPYRFEKRDRMLLMAAAEAVADVVEANRLTRDNQKLVRQLDEQSSQLRMFQERLNVITGTDDIQQALATICRSPVEKYNLLACRVVNLYEGELFDVARHEITPDISSHSESFRIAVIDAIRRKKMVILNQEAKAQGGGIYISRSALLCPFSLVTPGEYALLLEAPGSNGLPLTDHFLSDMDVMVHMVAIALNIAGLRQTDSRNQAAVRSLLSILKMKADERQELDAVMTRFLAEITPLLESGSSAQVYIRGAGNDYRLFDSTRPVPSELREAAFSIGEGPVGRVAATGEPLEIRGRSRVEEEWRHLEPANNDFLNYLSGEDGLPDYQLNIPITILNDVVAVVSVNSHSGTSSPVGREKAILLLAMQLLSIRLSMIRMSLHAEGRTGSDRVSDTGHILNDINNDLATVIGQAELLEQQPDLTGTARYAATEIITAAEKAAEAVRSLQAGEPQPEPPSPFKNDELIVRLHQFLESRRVTGNLYTFENNQPIMLQRDLFQPCPFVPRNEKLYDLIERVLRTFARLLDEGDEILLKSELRDGYFYLSLVRGPREKQGRFDPTSHDFGDPDVLPQEIADEEMIRTLVANGGTVSFDRFGRRPTYLSFRFPCSDQLSHTIENSASGVMGLRILAIDDQQMILDLLFGISQSLGLHLAAFRNPAQGLEYFKHEPVDVVMVDLAIGQVSGWDIAREIKKHSPETPVILMTGLGIDVDPDKAAHGGVDFTLTKPFRIEQLTDIITQAKTKYIPS